MYIKKAIRNKVKPIGINYRKHLPPPLNSDETAEAKLTRLQQEKLEEAKAHRRRQRRTTVRLFLAVPTPNSL
jgi:hypothetical protein